MDHEELQINMELRNSKKYIGPERLIYESSLEFSITVGSFHDFLNSMYETSAIKKDDPERISPLGVVKPGDVLLSHNL